MEPGGGIMREIKFRGKRVDNGEWVYGLPVNYCNKTYILVLTDFEEERVYEQYPHKEMWPYEVIPETVGQYTGLEDKNGQKIFEGDILYHPIQGKRKVYYPFSERVASYGLRMIEGKVRMASTLSEGFLYEVIGNIHDNTEVTE